MYTITNLFKVYINDIMVTVEAANQRVMMGEGTVSGFDVSG